MYLRAVIGLCKPGTFNVADSMGEAHILIRVLYNFLARYSTAPSRRPEAVDWPPSGADQACLEVTLEPNGGEAVAPLEAIADGYGDKCTDSSEECSDELEQCVCAALHCLHCALQNGLEREAPAAFFQSLLACLTELHIAIGSTGEEASAILHEVRRTPDVVCFALTRIAPECGSSQTAVGRWVCLRLQENNFL